LGVPVYRRRFSLEAGRSATERFCRLIRTAMAHAKQLREPFEGSLECNETIFGCARKGKRDWERPARSSE
jgi:transposase